MTRKEEIKEMADGYPLNNNITHWMPLPQPPKKGDEQ